MEKTTRIEKGHDGWQAKTELDLPGVTRVDHTGTCQGVLTIRTAKMSRGGLQTSASVAFRSGMFMSHLLYQDYNVAVERNDSRCTEKAIRTLHDKALAILPELIVEATAHYAKELV